MQNNQFNIPQWDREQSWKAIDSRLRNKRKKLRFFWWLGSGGMLLLITALYFSLSSDPITNGQVTEQLTQQDSKQPQIMAKQQTASSNVSIANTSKT